jgi:RND superfamily putative drug exporter
MQLQQRPSIEEATASSSSTPPQLSEAAPGADSGVQQGQTEGQLERHGLYRVGLAYGRLIYRLRWLILALWLIGLAASVPFASSLSSVLSGGGYNFSGSESAKAANLAIDAVRQPASQVLVVFQSTDTLVSDASYQDELNSFIARARALDHLTSVAPGPISDDGKTTFAVLGFDRSAETVQQGLGDLRAALPTGGPARTYVTGDPAVYDEFNRITQEQTQRAEVAALPLALVVLVIVFGTLVAAALPLTLALFAVPIALAVVYAIAVHQQTSIFVLSIASIIGLGISIDYSLFMVRRFREELARGRSVRDAVGWTVATAGEAILFSGLTVMIGFCGLMLIGIQFMTSMGIGGATVVAVAVVAALTLLPALLSVLGTRVNALRIPLLGRLVGATTKNEAHEDEQRGFWHGLALGVMRRPVLVIVGVGVLLVALGWPIFSLRVGVPDASALPKTSEARQGSELLSAQFPQFGGNTLQIAVQTPDGSSILSADNLARLDALTLWLDAQPDVSGVVSLTQFPVGPQGQVIPKEQLFALYSSGAYRQNPGLAQLVDSTTAAGTTLVTVRSDLAVGSDAAASQITSLRAHKDQAQGLQVYVGGFQALTQDFDGYLYTNFPRAIAFILLATFVVLLVMFRSLLLPLKAVLMNVLSVSAAYGVLVFVFEQGHFADLLNFEPSSTIDSTIPILLFCVLFGLSMDYEVFLLSRIREEWLRTKNNRYAVARGLEKTGGVITNAALLFVIVTGAFTFTGIVITKEIGLGMTVAVLVDAAIIRTLLVPATMRLVGRWNWWLPGFPLPPKQGT